MNTMNDEVYWAINEVGLARKSLDKAIYAVQSYLSGQRDDELLQIAVDYLMCCVVIDTLVEYTGKARNTIKNWVDEHPGFVCEGKIVRRAVVKNGDV